MTIVQYIIMLVVAATAFASNFHDPVRVFFLDPGIVLQELLVL